MFDLLFDSEEQFLKEFFETITEYKTDKKYNKDLDINCTLKLKKKEILKGTIKKTIKINNKKIIVEVPSNIQNGQTIILQHEGKKIKNNYGNLNIKVNIGKSIF